MKFLPSIYSESTRRRYLHFVHGHLSANILTALTNHLVRISLHVMRGKPLFKMRQRNSSYVMCIFNLPSIWFPILSVLTYLNTKRRKTCVSRQVFTFVKAAFDHKRESRRLLKLKSVSYINFSEVFSHL